MACLYIQELLIAVILDLRFNIAGLHGLQQLHVSFITSSTFHLVVQLENDLILELQRKNREGEKAKSRQKGEEIAHERRNRRGNQLCKHN